MSGREPKLNRFLNFTARLLVGGIFVYAGASKILDPVRFADAVAAYQMLPVSVINLVAIMLPWVEVVAGILAVMGFWLPASSLVIASLMSLFMLALTQAMARGLKISCGCFGSGMEPITGLTVARDVFIWVLSVALCWRASEAQRKWGTK